MKVLTLSEAYFKPKIMTWRNVVADTKTMFILCAIFVQLNVFQEDFEITPR